MHPSHCHKLKQHLEIKAKQPLAAERRPLCECLCAGVNPSMCWPPTMRQAPPPPRGAFVSQTRSWSPASHWLQSLGSRAHSPVRNAEQFDEGTNFPRDIFIKKQKQPSPRAVPRTGGLGERGQDRARHSYPPHWEAVHSPWCPHMKASPSSSIPDECPPSKL